MSVNFKNFSLRKLKISDYYEFRKLFYSCFKKKISFEFYRWRYFSNKFSFCYGAFEDYKLVANVGMVSIQKSKNLNDIIYSRHSSMVLKNYRGFGIFSKLLKVVKKNFLKNISLVFMWPNKKNFSNFDISKKNILEKKYYLYKTRKISNLNKEIKNHSISEMLVYEKFIKNKKSPFFKDLNYFKKRYLSYCKNEYFLNKFVIGNQVSFFILKRNKDKSDVNNVILDHFGSKKIYNKHLSYLIKNLDKLIFLTKTRRNNSQFQLINSLNVKIGFMKKINMKKKKNFFKDKEIYLGDTDIFISI
jgi:hypothetical protein